MKKMNTKRRNKVKPTELQKKTIQILRENPDKSLSRAMREAGYKPITSLKPKQNFTQLKGTAIAIEKWREALRGSGLNENLLINKYKEWINATKVKSSFTEPDKVVPDYETQLKVKDDIRRDFGLPIGNPPTIAQQFNVGATMSLEFIGNEVDNASEAESVAVDSSERPA